MFTPEDGSRASYRNVVFQSVMLTAQDSQLYLTARHKTAAGYLTTTNHDHCLLPEIVSL
jgi:hypothetical protein